MSIVKVEICDNWNGFDKVCDSERCKAELEKCNQACYHKPFSVDGKRMTVIEAINHIFGGKKR